METELKDLISKIKKEGTDSAEKERKDIVENAKKEAESIISEAKRNAASELEKAKSEISKLEESGKSALVQASRDLLLNVKGQLEKLLQSTVKECVKASFSQDVLEKAVLEAVKSLTTEGYTLSLPKDLLSSVEASLKTKLSKGVFINASAKISAGFTITEKDGKAYYDFTDESIASLLSDFLNPTFKAILESSLK